MSAISAEHTHTHTQGSHTGHLLVDGVGAHDAADHANLLTNEKPVSMEQGDDKCHAHQPWDGRGGAGGRGREGRVIQVEEGLSLTCSH